MNFLSRTAVMRAADIRSNRTRGRGSSNMMARNDLKIRSAEKTVWRREIIIQLSEPPIPIYLPPRYWEDRIGYGMSRRLEERADAYL